ERKRLAELADEIPKVVVRHPARIAHEKRDGGRRGADLGRVVDPDRTLASPARARWIVLGGLRKDPVPFRGRDVSARVLVGGHDRFGELVDPLMRERGKE